MKLIALAAALALSGGAALAQDAAAPAAPATTEATPAAQDPTGGYQPTAPAMSAQPQPGQQVIFQPSKSPSEAYPPPPAMADYPVCKKGQYDNCRQPGG